MQTIIKYNDYIVIPSQLLLVFCKNLMYYVFFYNKIFMINGLRIN